MKKLSVLILIFSIGMGNIYAQGALERLGKRVIKRAGEQVEQRVERKAEEGVEKAMDKAEKATRKGTKEQNKTVKPTDEKHTESTPQQESASLQSFSQYDFVPGDKVLLFDDFSQDAVGDFPALWTTNGSGEIKTINLTPGNWLHMTSTGMQYQLMKRLDLPTNYIIEFDVILPTTNFNPPAIWLNLFNTSNDDVGYVENNPLSLGFGLYIEASDFNPWMAKAYHTNTGGNWVEGGSTLAPTKIDQVEHIIVWVQKRRLRVYHAGQKVMDMPTLIPADLKPNRLAFNIADCNDSNPYISNLRITTASPDTRNKLLEEGKLISYGIYFDVNSDNVKPESFGALNDIAKVIIEANIAVKIVGHTDSSGDDASNLDLSKRRAASVKAALVKMGVSESLLKADGAGETAPLAPNDTPSNKALNRRVEFIKQ